MDAAEDVAFVSSLIQDHSLEPQQSSEGNTDDAFMTASAQIDEMAWKCHQLFQAVSRVSKFS